MLNKFYLILCFVAIQSVLSAQLYNSIYSGTDVYMPTFNKAQDLSLSVNQSFFNRNKNTNYHIAFRPNSKIETKFSFKTGSEKVVSHYGLRALLKLNEYQGSIGMSVFKSNNKNLNSTILIDISAGYGKAKINQSETYIFNYGPFYRTNLKIKAERIKI